MSRHKAYALNPRDCLKTTLFQKWQKMVAPPGKGQFSQMQRTPIDFPTTSFPYQSYFYIRTHTFVHLFFSLATSTFVQRETAKMCKDFFLFRCEKWCLHALSQHIFLFIQLAIFKCGTKLRQYPILCPKCQVMVGVSLVAATCVSPHLFLLYYRTVLPHTDTIRPYTLIEIYIASSSL